MHLSNLCTEIIEVSTDGETAVCNLGSVNLAAHLHDGRRTRRDRLGAAARDRAHRGAASWTGSSTSTTTRAEQAAASNPRWRPVGLGVMGLQDVFFALRLPFDSAEARELSTRIAEEIYLTALEASVRPGRAARPAPGVRRDPRRRAASLQPDLLGRRRRPRPSAGRRCAREIAEHGLRNSLLIAIAPTATIASIAGCYECIEPQVSNLFKRETLSGEFLQVNAALVARAEGARPVDRRGPRGDQAGRGLGAGHHRAARRTCGALFRTAWELPQRGADRHGRRARRRTSTRASR